MCGWREVVAYLAGRGDGTAPVGGITVVVVDVFGGSGVAVGDGRRELGLLQAVRSVGLGLDAVRASRLLLLDLILAD